MMTKDLRIHSFILQIKINEIKHFVKNNFVIENICLVFEV